MAFRSAPRLQKLGIAAATCTGAKVCVVAKGFSNFAFGNMLDPYDARGLSHSKRSTAQEISNFM